MSGVTKPNGLPTASLSQAEAETHLQAWGAHQRAEVAREVGLSPVSASCADYDAPDWEAPPAPKVSEADIQRACWAMVMAKQHHPRIHRDLRDHYRDGMRLGYQTLCHGRDIFASMWSRWDA